MFAHRPATHSTARLVLDSQPEQKLAEPSLVAPLAAVSERQWETVPARE